MLKRTIAYETFDGVHVTEDFYFNLSKSELIELEAEYKDGLAAALNRIVETGDAKQIIAEFKRLVLLAYGQKSEDGKRFIKSDQLRLEFSQTPAYDELFMELATQAEAAATFITGIIPKDMVEKVEQAREARVSAEPVVPQLAPPPPPAPAPTHVDL